MFRPGAMTPIGSPEDGEMCSSSPADFCRLWDLAGKCSRTLDGSMDEGAWVRGVQELFPIWT